MSTFQKNCVTATIILFVSYLVLAMSLMYVIQQFLLKKEERTLVRYCETIAESYLQLYDVKDLSSIDFHKIEEEIKILDDYTSMNFIVVDDQFRVLVTASNSIASIGDNIEEEIFNQVMQDKIIITEQGLSGIFNEQVFAVAYPIKIWDKVVGAIIVSTSMPVIHGNIKQISTLVVLCLIVSCAISMLIMYTFTKRLSRPIEKISKGAKFFAQGNFDKRIEIDSNDEIGTLAKCLNDMADDLDNQEKIRTKFISNISHDLRSPLTSINGFLQVLCDDVVPEEKRVHYLNIIYDETKRLRKLVDDILDISKVSNKEVKLNKSVNDINELIEKTLKAMLPHFESKNITVEKIFESEKCYALFDYDKIHRVLYNLIDNAYKFTPENGIIKLSVYSNDKNKYCVSVKDNGIGLKEEDQRRIFDRFYKIDYSRSVDKGGSGLGLSIVKDFVNEHNEEIELHSAHHQGCEFVFTLEKANQIEE